MSRTPELVNIAMIGDRLVTTAGELGVHPSLMATALTPMIEDRFPLSRQIECTACVMGPKQSAFLGLAKRLGITRIVLEKSPDPRLDAATIASKVEEEGFDVEVADFSGTTLQGIVDTGRILDRGKRAKKIADKYETEMGNAFDRLPDNLGKRVLILLGLPWPGKATSLLLVEEESQADEMILTPCGCVNVGHGIPKTGDPTDDHPIRVIKNLDGLMEAAPDMIALTGDAAPGLAAIRNFVKQHPQAAQLPAIANHAVFSLPHCCEGEPLALPGTLRSWCRALEAV